MRLFRAVLIIGIIFLYIPTSWAGELVGKVSPKEGVYLSLYAALQLAVLNNFDIQMSLYDRKINTTDIDDAKSIYDTVLTLTGEYEYDRNEQASAILGSSSHTGSASAELSKLFVTGADVSVIWENIRESTDSAFATMNPSYESSLEMKFTQPLLRNFFGMNDWGEVLITKIDVHNYNSEVLDDIEEDLADVEKAYWDLVVAIQKVEARKAAYKTAEDFYELNIKKKELGTSELTDLLAAEANKELRLSELMVEQDNLMAALNELRLLINHPKIDKYILPIEVLGIADNEISFIESLKVAFENRRDYERAKKTIKAKKIKFNMKRNERWPQLDFEGSLKLNGVERLYKDAAADAFTHENPEYYAKMTFSFPFEDREAKSAYNKSKYEKAKALIDFKKVEKTIVTEIDDIARKVNVYKDKAMQSIRIEELQKKKLEEEERQFRYGRSDSDRIIRFQEDLLIAKLRALDSLNAYKDFLIDLYLTQDTYLDKKGLTVP